MATTEEKNQYIETLKTHLISVRKELQITTQKTKSICRTTITAAIAGSIPVGCSLKQKLNDDYDSWQRDLLICRRKSEIWLKSISELDCSSLNSIEFANICLQALNFSYQISDTLEQWPNNFEPRLRSILECTNYDKSSDELSEQDD